MRPAERAAQEEAHIHICGNASMQASHSARGLASRATGVGLRQSGPRRTIHRGRHVRCSQFQSRMKTHNRSARARRFMLRAGLHCCEQRGSAATFATLWARRLSATVRIALCIGGSVISRLQAGSCRLTRRAYERCKRVQSAARGRSSAEEQKQGRKTSKANAQISRQGRVPNAMACNVCTGGRTSTESETKDYTGTWGRTYVDDLVSFTWSLV